MRKLSRSARAHLLAILTPIDRRTRHTVDWSKATITIGGHAFPGALLTTKPGDTYQPIARRPIGRHSGSISFTISLDAGRNWN
jgi:hypothetical protein